MKHITVITFVAALSILFLAGCQESEAGQTRRARLIANENLQLQEQLTEKNNEIKDLKKLIEEMEAEKAKTHEEFGETITNVMQIATEVEKQNEILLVENEKLKEELKKLKTQ